MFDTKEEEDIVIDAVIQWIAENIENFVEILQIKRARGEQFSVSVKRQRSSCGTLLDLPNETDSTRG